MNPKILPTLYKKKPKKPTITHFRQPAFIQKQLTKSKNLIFKKRNLQK